MVKTTMLLLLLVVLSGCGSGGKGSVRTPAEEERYQKNLYALSEDVAKLSEERKAGKITEGRFRLEQGRLWRQHFLKDDATVPLQAVLDRCGLRLPEGLEKLEDSSYATFYASTNNYTLCYAGSMATMMKYYRETAALLKKRADAAGDPGKVNFSDSAAGIPVLETPDANLNRQANAAAKEIFGRHLALYDKTGTEFPSLLVELSLEDGKYLFLKIEETQPEK